jgi:hypothetical protein
MPTSLKDMGFSSRNRAFWVLAALLTLLAAFYQVRGLRGLTIGQDRGDALDLRLRWTEERYFLDGKNPYDVWLNNAPRVREAGLQPAPGPRDASVDPELGLADPAHPPWAYISGVLFFWPDWPIQRWYFAALNLVAIATLAGWAFRMGRPYGRGAGAFLAAAALALGGMATTLEVGQYGVLVTALLAGALFFEASDDAVFCGLCVGLSLAKPTLGGPFLLALLLTRRYRAFAVTSVYLLLACSAVWADTRTSPAEMLGQLLAVGAVIGQDGTVGLTDLLLRIGLDPRLATLGGMVVVLLPAAVAMYRAPGRSLPLAFAIAAVASRLWTYHRSYDNVMLVLLLVPLGRVALGRPESRLVWLAFLATGLTLWIPARVSDLPLIQVVQIAVWLFSVAVLFVQPQRDTATLPPAPQPFQQAGLAAG